MTKLKKIGVLSAAKIEGLLGVIVGLILGVIVALFGAIFSSFLGDGEGMGMMLGGGLGAIIFLPLLYGAIGFISGAIGAALFNVVAKWIGGLEIELENK